MGESKLMKADMFGIKNHVGSIWSPSTFQTRSEANAFLNAAREEWARKGLGDLSKHHVVPVKVTIKEIVR